MRLLTSCLEDDQILQVLTGEPDSARFRAHLDDCVNCRGRLDQLQTDVLAMMKLGPGSRRRRVQVAQSPARFPSARASTLRLQRRYV